MKIFPNFEISMNKTRYLQLQFDQPFQAFDIPKLRAAIIEKTKRESSLFHNHEGENGYIYRYPLIQYKIKDKKPCLICLKEATEDIHYLLREKNFDFKINGTNISFEIEDVRLKYEKIQTWDTDFQYSLLHYLALNQENFDKYKNQNGLLGRISMLEQLLLKHLEIFAKEMEAYLPLPLFASILNIKEEKYIEYKNVFHLAFTLDFKSNLHIPEYVGIGKGASVGFGIVKKIINYNQNIQTGEK